MASGSSGLRWDCPGVAADNRVGPSRVFATIVCCSARRSREESQGARVALARTHRHGGSVRGASQSRSGCSTARYRHLSCNCSDSRRFEGLRFENRGRIPVWEAQADGNQTAFDQFDPPNLNFYPLVCCLLPAKPIAIIPQVPLRGPVAQAVRARS